MNSYVAKLRLEAVNLEDAKRKFSEVISAHETLQEPGDETKVSIAGQVTEDAPCGFSPQLNILKLSCICGILALIAKKGKLRHGVKSVEFEQDGEDRVPDACVWEEHGGIEMGYVGDVEGISLIKDNPNDAIVTVSLEGTPQRTLLSSLCAEDIAAIHEYLDSLK